VALVAWAACSSGGGRLPDAAVSDALPAREAGPDAPFGQAIEPGGCGNPGGACCPGNQCAEGGCCVEGRCAGAGTACAPLDGICQQGSCGACGGQGQSCCAGGACTGLATRCAGGICEACGDLGQLCCPGGACLRGGTVCDLAAAGSGAVIGVCAACHTLDCLGACGGAGQPCCAAGSPCADGGCCVSGACVAAGGACQVGGAGYGTCSGGSCGGCGGMGAPCCPAAISGQAACGAPTTACIIPDMPPGPATCSKCGGKGEPCCAFNRCDGGCCTHFRPSDPGTCVVEGQDCADGAVCVQGSCGMCGGAGHLCCSGRCSAAQTSCAVVAGQGERCLACGGRGMPCCLDQPQSDACLAPLACRGGLCLER
jgi:hypothetical protein